ncbi:MAG: hypothetical protein LUF30_07230, partial [Lachnospiraceae bacterium]|nr:hypothetical protein [Lachnospiraceae bacterium]
YTTADGTADQSTDDAADDTTDNITDDTADDTATTRTVLSERLTLTPQPQASLVLIEQSTGLVRAIVGGRGEKTASLTLNRATDTTRQPGSTFKILTAYAPALDAGGQTLATLYENEPYEYEDGTAVSNWDITDYSGTVTIREAITRSINVVAVRCITEITPRLGFTYAQHFGISTLVDGLNSGSNSSDVASLSGVTDIIQPLALGGITNGVTNLELCAAYAAIANEGVYNRPLFFTKVLDREGNVLLCASDSYLSAAEQSATVQSATAQSSTSSGVLTDLADETEASAGQDLNLSGSSALSASTRVLQESTAFLLTSAMEDVVSSEAGTAYGTISAAGQPVAGKTGTTSAYKDIWFVGYTPYYTCSVWGGYDNNQSLPDTSTGHSYSRILWTAVMERVHAGLPIGSFTQPDTIKKVTLCSESHLLAQENICPDVYTEYFAEGTEPTESCSIHETETESETIYIYQDLLNELLPETETDTETEPLEESQEDTNPDSIDTSESEKEPGADPGDETASESGNESLSDDQGETLPGDGDETLPDSENDSLSNSSTESRQDNVRETSPLGDKNQINITAEPDSIEESSSLDDLLSRLVGQGLSLP